MDIEINYNLSVGKNADNKYKLKNKYESKIKGLDIAIESTKKKLDKLNKKVDVKKSNLFVEKKKVTTKKWYSKFRWFFTTNGFLVLAGRDSKNNEYLIKKHLEENDVYFHADVFGAPHVILKNQNKAKIPAQDLVEAAEFAAIFSSAWKNQIFSVDVYSVAPDQVSKTANTGESLGTGAFVIRGKRKYYKKITMELAISFSKELGLFVSPISAVTKYSPKYFVLVPGSQKKSEVANELKNRFFEKLNIKLTTDEIDAVLPSGKSSIKD